MSSYSKRTLTVLLFFFLASSSAFSQTFNLLKKADDEFVNTNFFLALDAYLKVYDKKQDDASVIEKIVYCNKSLHNYNDVLTWCNQLVRLEPKNLVYKLEHARAQHSLGKFSEAKAEYQEYLKFAPTDQKLVKDYIRSCDSGLKWTKNPDLSLQVQNVSLLNTPYDEFGLTRFSGGFMFASDRKNAEAQLLSGNAKNGNNQEIFGFTGRPYLKLYYVSQNGDSSWGEPSFFSKLMGERYHTSNASYDEKNNILYFTRTRKVEVPKSFSKSVFRAELVYSEAFREIKPFPFNSTLNYSVGDPCISKGGKRIYFSSGMPGGQGGTDLYYCDQASDGAWKPPVNMGPKINTPGEERFPTIYNDSILYFSSDGHTGMGGLDLFTTTLQRNGVWSPVRNLGAPLNSAEDDFSLIITGLERTPNGKNAIQGYFSSDRLGGKGSDDIYFFKSDTQFTSKAENALFAQGKILDTETGSGIAEVNLDVNEVNKPEVTKYRTDSAGSYKFPVKKDKKYAVTFKKPKYFTKTDTLSAPTKEKPQMAVRNERIQPMIIDKPVRLENIYYSFNSWEITAKSAYILEGLVKVLNQNAEIDVEIDSHTDTRGDIEINKYISQQRAKAVVNYLVSRGIRSRRLTARGYGKELPLVKCDTDHPCTESDHSQNRRTEFRVVKIGDQASK